MRDLLANLPALRTAIEKATGPRFALSQVKLAAPIDDPQKFLAIGMNYVAHANEAAAAGIPIPKSSSGLTSRSAASTGRTTPSKCPKRLTRSTTRRSSPS